MTARREFLRRASLFAAGTVASGAVAGPLSAQRMRETGQPAADAPHGQAQGALANPAAPGDWDMSWADRVTGRHRMCFDAPEISEGTCLHQVRSFLQGYADAFGLTDTDLSAVLVVRHAAMPMVLDDALWVDGAFAEEEELVDPESGEPARRNPFIRIPAGARHALTWPDGALDTLMARGVIVLACDLALRNFAGQIARRQSIPLDDAHAAIARNLLPGVVRMPSGIFATSHAQGLGCGVMNAV